MSSLFILALLLTWDLLSSESLALAPSSSAERGQIPGGGDTISPFVKVETGALAPGPVPLTELSGTTNLSSQIAERRNYVQFIAELNKAPVLLNRAFAIGINKIVPCEGGYAGDTIGIYGEVGPPQIHPIHFPEMKELGLNPESISDTYSFSELLWRRNGWTDWQSSFVCHLIK